MAAEAMHRYEGTIMAQSATVHHRQVIDDENTHRHWCPQSEKFAPCDALQSALEDGWKIHGVVFRQEHWQSGGRRVLVYHFKLQRAGQLANMVVIENPFVMRLINNLKVQVVAINQRKDTSVERW